ncbi:Transcriptional regulator, TetR family [Micromonospora sp. MW-13]|nr:Transcriptional regulator, TetR family [Micromonospora sp. MW-13]
MRQPQAILAAARDLVAELGYPRTSIEAIARRAGVGKQTTYRWWPSKGAVVPDAVRALSEDEAGAIILPDTGDLEADLTTVLRATAVEFLRPGAVGPAPRPVRRDRRRPGPATFYQEKVDRPLTEAKLARLAARRPGSAHAGTSSWARIAGSVIFSSSLRSSTLLRMTLVIRSSSANGRNRLRWAVSPNEAGTTHR